MKKIIPVPAANAAIFNEGKILLTQRSLQIREGGKWCLPGGHVEKGESWQTAMIREVFEETGLIVRSYHLLGIYSDPDLTITPQPYYQGAHGQFVSAVFVVRNFEGEVKPNQEVETWGWFDLSSLPAPLLRSHPIRIEDAFRFQGGAFVR